MGCQLAEMRHERQWGSAASLRYGEQMSEAASGQPG